MTTEKSEKRNKSKQPKVAEYIVRDCPIMGKVIVKHIIDNKDGNKSRKEVFN